MRDETRRMPPFGSSKGEGRHDQASKRRTGGVASSQVDPPQGGTSAHTRRHGRWRDRSPRRLLECMDGPAPLAFVRPPAAPREVRLNGFPGALAEVPRHRFGGSGRRVPGAAPTAVFGASKVGQPAYAVLNTAAGKGSAPLPLDPWGFPRRCSARRRTRPLPEPRRRSRRWPSRRRSAKRRSAIAAKPSAAILARFGADCLGVEGAEPPASPAVIPGVGWLGPPNSGPSQPGGRPRNAPASRPRRRWPGRRGQALRPLGCRPHGRRARRATRHFLATAAHPAAHRFPPYPVPLGDPRSSILGDPAARRSPEMPPGPPGNAF